MFLILFSILFSFILVFLSNSLFILCQYILSLLLSSDILQCFLYFNNYSAVRSLLCPFHSSFTISSFYSFFSSIFHYISHFLLTFLVPFPSSPFLRSLCVTSSTPYRHLDQSNNLVYSSPLFINEELDGDFFRLYSAVQWTILLSSYIHLNIMFMMFSVLMVMTKSSGIHMESKVETCRYSTMENTQFLNVPRSFLAHSYRMSRTNKLTVQVTCCIGNKANQK